MNNNEDLEREYLKNAISLKKLLYSRFPQEKKESCAALALWAWAHGINAINRITEIVKTINDITSDDVQAWLEAKENEEDPEEALKKSLQGHRGNNCPPGIGKILKKPEEEE